MNKPLFIAAVIFILALRAAAQGVEAVPAAADVVLELGTDGGLEFHLGEFIPIRFSYRANVSGKYFWVGNGMKLLGGRALDIACSPAAESVRQSASSDEDATFGQMLMATCSGVGAGSGGGVGGGCFDCDGDIPLTASAFTFGVVPLNTYVRFRTAGTYTCQASSAEITATPRVEKVRHALLVKSNPIVLTVVEDPGWAHTAAAQYADAYDKTCRGDDVVEHRSLQCFDISRRITYLDTAESLAVEVHAFDGKNHGWENGFWDAIRESSYPREAVRLMAVRIQDPDFQVSRSVLEWLARLEMKMEDPDAFKGGTPASYHAAAVDKLHKYVRLVGDSLSKKNSDVLPESAKTYRMLAGSDYCQGQTLISREEQNRALAAHR